MSLADKSELNAFIYRDHMLPKVTPQAVADALDGFALPRVRNRSTDWLAMAVRRALAATLRNVGETPDRPKNADVRDELKGLATTAKEAWLAIWQRSPCSDSRIWDHAWRCWDGEGGNEVGDGITIGDPADHRRFNAALAELDWLGSFLHRAAEATEAQPPRWREAERRELRIERAQYLFPIFEATFEPVQLNTFTDFYQRMVWLAFEEGDIPDLEALISEMKRRHDRAPVTFNPDFIPGL